MSIQKPNCSTCTNPKCPVMATPGHKPDEVGWYPEIVSSIRECGCLSHPGAREYLMAPVIKELERQATELESREPKFGTRMECEHIANMHNKAEGMRTAIFFIRDGVK